MSGTRWAFAIAIGCLTGCTSQEGTGPGDDSGIDASDGGADSSVETRDSSVIDAFPSPDSGTPTPDASADGEADDAPTDGVGPSIDASEEDGATQNGDAGPAGPLCTAMLCPAGQTYCGGLCVSASDPAFGCGTCTPCSLAHAQPTCTASGACAIQACQPGWADVDGMAANECEVSLSSAAACGSIGATCSGRTPLCGPTGCVAACSPPLTQCGSSCVSLAASPDNCGGCGNACSTPNGFPSCQQGMCGVATCFAGFTSCGGKCVDTSTDSQNCGTCGTSCPTATNAVRTCNGGSCGVVCQQGWTACGNACVAAQGDPEHCGATCKACGSGQVCISGSCVPAASLWLTTGLSSPVYMATDSTNIYFVETGTGNVSAIAKTGGAVNVLASNRSKPLSIAVDDAFVYWSENLGGGIFRTAKGGGDTAHLVAAASAPTDIAVAASYVYFIGGQASPLWRAPKDGSSTATAAVPPVPGTGGFTMLGFDGSQLYAFTPFGSGTDLDLVDPATAAVTPWGETQGPQAVTGNASYFGIAEWNYVVWVSKVTGQRGFLNSNNLAQDALATTSCGFVSGEPTSPKGLFLLLFNSAFPTELVSASPNRIAVDGATVYWTDASGAIGRFALP